jgi:cytidylate kinase
MPPIASIAIDGPVASGKTAVGRAVAGRLGLRFLDTGAMYRAVTWAAVQRGTGLDDPNALTELAESIEMLLVADEAGDRLLVDGEDVTDHLRDRDVERGVSLVSAVSGVRTAMVSQQRAVARQGPIVMVGRDIGTVVLPDADVKVFLEASVDVRAGRRYHELCSQGKSLDYQHVVDDLTSRDKIDRERADSPLTPASDAVRLHTDDLNVDQVVERIVTMASAP